MLSIPRKRSSLWGQSLRKYCLYRSLNERNVRLLYLDGRIGKVSFRLMYLVGDPLRGRKDGFGAIHRDTVPAGYLLATSTML